MSSLTTKYVYADNDSQKKDNPTIFYGLDPATWAEFAKSHQTPNWQVCLSTFLFQNELSMIFLLTNL